MSRRIALGLAVGALALLAGGSVRALLAIAVLLAVLNAIIPMPAGTSSQADDRFRRLVSRRRPRHRAATRVRLSRRGAARRA